MMTIISLTPKCALILVPVESDAGLMQAVTIWYTDLMDSWRNLQDSSMFQKILVNWTVNQELGTFLDCVYPQQILHHNMALHPGTKSVGKRAIKLTDTVWVTTSQRTCSTELHFWTHSCGCGYITDIRVNRVILAPRWITVLVYLS